MNEFKRFEVIKTCPIAGGDIAQGTIIDIVHGCVYVNNCMMTPLYQNEIMRIISKETAQGFNYLRPKPVPYNKV